MNVALGHRPMGKRADHPNQEALVGKQAADWAASESRTMSGVAR